MPSNPRDGRNHEEGQCRHIRHRNAEVAVQLLQLAEEVASLLDIRDVVVDRFRGRGDVVEKAQHRLWVVRVGPQAPSDGVLRGDGVGFHGDAVGLGDGVGGRRRSEGMDHE